MQQKSLFDRDGSVVHVSHTSLGTSSILYFVGAFNMNVFQRNETLPINIFWKDMMCFALTMGLFMRFHYEIENFHVHAE